MSSDLCKYLNNLYFYFEGGDGAGSSASGDLITVSIPVASDRIKNPKNPGIQRNPPTIFIKNIAAPITISKIARTRWRFF